MNSRSGWKIVLCLTITALLLAAISGFAAQNQSSTTTKTEIQKVPTPNVNPASGKEMYSAYCASCHGTNATGNGPAASSLKVAPANLTLLAKKNGGKFPDAKVQQAIKGDVGDPDEGDGCRGGVPEVQSGGEESERDEERVAEVVQGGSDAGVEEIAEHEEVRREEEDGEEEPAEVQVSVEQDGCGEDGEFFDAEEDGGAGEGHRSVPEGMQVEEAAFVAASLCCR